MPDTKPDSTLYSLTAAAHLLGVPRDRLRYMAVEAGIGRTRFGVRDALLFSPADIEGRCAVAPEVSR